MAYNDNCANAGKGDGNQHRKAGLTPLHGEFNLPPVSPTQKVLTLGFFVGLAVWIGLLLPRYLPPEKYLDDGQAFTASEAEQTKQPADSLTEGMEEEPESSTPTDKEWKEEILDHFLKAYDRDSSNLRLTQYYWEVKIPRGKPIHEYALELENLTRARNIRILEGRELPYRHSTIEYHLQKEGKELKLRLKHDESFLPGSAKLALVFTALDSCSELELAALEGLPWAKTFVVNPYTENRILKKLQFTGDQTELLLQLPMEPAAYPYVQPGPNALLIHQNREQIEEILKKALEAFPEAQGFASKHGRRAVENRPLVDNLFRFLGERNLVFLDLTASPRSLTRSAAWYWEASCWLAQPVSDPRALPEEMIKRIVSAQKTGASLLVLPFSPSALSTLRTFVEQRDSWLRNQGVQFVTLSSLQDT